MSRNLLIVSQYFWPEDFRINELATALARRGHRVAVLTSWPNYPEGRIFPAFAADRNAFDRLEDVVIYRVPQIPRGKGRFRLALNYLSFAVIASIQGPWKLRGQGFDAVLAFQTSPVTVGIPAIVLSRVKHAPMIMWILDCWPETLKAIGVAGGRLAQGAVGLLVRAIYAGATLLPGQSRGFEANVARYGNAAKFRHFPNWVEDVYLAPPVRPPAPDPARPFTITYAGNVGEAQDFPAVLDAAAQIAEHPILWRIVGDGRDLARLQADVEARGLGHRVRFEGRHPASAMPGFFAQADALLVSLRRDPLFAMTVPGKVQTYLAAGRPILAMLDGEGADIIRAADAGIAVPAGDSAGLARAVLDLARLPAEARARMGENGRKYALHHYRLETLLSRLEGWIEEAITDPQGVRR